LNQNKTIWKNDRDTF